MKKQHFCILFLVCCSWLWLSGPALAQFGELPPAAVSASQMGKADELVLYIMFDPAIAHDLLPEGLRFRTLEEIAKRGNSDAVDYLRSHPEHQGWARSFFEIIHTESLEYDGYKARLGVRGGIAVWYANVVRIDSSDTRPKGGQYLALGTWLSDKKLVEHMKAKGYPAEYAEIEFWQDPSSVVHGKMKAEGLQVNGQCRLSSDPYKPTWDAPPNFQTIWTPRPLGRTFEIVTYFDHIQRDCSAAEWQLKGSNRLVKAFGSRAKGGKRISGTDYYGNYILRGGLYRSHQDHSEGR
jgi:hypothetical protein